MLSSLSYPKKVSPYLHPACRQRRNKYTYNECLAQKYDKHRIQDLMNMYFGCETDGSYCPNSYELTVVTRAQNTMVKSRLDEGDGYFTTDEEEADLESSLGGFSLNTFGEMNSIDMASDVHRMDTPVISNTKGVNEKHSIYSQPKVHEVTDKHQMVPINEHENNENIPPDMYTISQEIVPKKSMSVQNNTATIKRNEGIRDNIEMHSDVSSINIKIINIHDQNKLERTPSMTESSISATSELSSTIISMNKYLSPPPIESVSLKYRSEHYAQIAALKTAHVRSRNYLRDTAYSTSKSKFNSNGEKNSQDNTTNTKETKSTGESDMESHASSIVQELQSHSLNYPTCHHPLLMDTKSHAGYSYAAHSYTGNSHAGIISYDPASYNGDHVDGTTTSIHKDDAMSVGSFNTHTFSIVSGTSFYTANTSIAELKSMKRNLERKYASIQDRIGPLIHCSICDELKEEEEM